MEHTMLRIVQCIRESKGNEREPAGKLRGIKYQEMHKGTNGVIEKQKQPTDTVMWQKPLGESPALCTMEHVHLTGSHKLQWNYTEMLKETNRDRALCGKLLHACMTRSARLTSEWTHLEMMKEHTRYVYVWTHRGRARKNKTEGKAHEMNRKLVEYWKKEMRGTHAGIAYGETHRKTYSETHVK